MGVILVKYKAGLKLSESENPVQENKKDVADLR